LRTFFTSSRLSFRIVLDAKKQDGEAGIGAHPEQLFIVGDLHGNLGGKRQGTGLGGIPGDDACQKFSGCFGATR
jgi:hypothetical protein